MARRFPLDIAVVGAGVTGLASATVLARDGHCVRLFERFETSRPLGSGLMLQPTGLAALDRLGLRDDIERRGQRIDRLHGMTDRKTVIFDVAYADLDPSFHAVAVHRAALHGVLWDAFAGCGADLEASVVIAGIEHVSNGRVLVRDERGRAVGPFDLVVDASGANSRLRAAVTAKRPKPFAYGAVWATVPDLGAAPGRLAQRYVAARIMMGYLPIGTIDGSGEPLAALFWSLKPADHAQWRSGYESWRDEAARLWPELQALVAALPGPDSFTLASYSHFLAPRFHAGPVVLVGDAAHSTSPQLGQGANQGLLDALALADSLAEAGDIASALRDYESRRRAHVRFYQIASGLLTGFFQSDSRSLAWARDRTFHRMRLVPYLRREMIRTLGGLKTGLFTAASPEEIAGRREGEP